MRKVGICVLTAAFFITNFAARVRSQDLSTDAIPAADSRRDADSSLILPASVEVTKSLRPLVAKVAAKSRTFRKQCRAVGAAANLHIKIEMSHPAELASYRAITTFQRVGRQITGTMRIVVPAWNFAEIIGHEFEHVLEQLEGVNLKVLSSKRGSGVYRVESGSFETQRAIEAGREVAREYEGAAHKH